MAGIFDAIVTHRVVLSYVITFALGMLAAVYLYNAYLEKNDKNSAAHLEKTSVVGFAPVPAVRVQEVGVGHASAEAAPSARKQAGKPKPKEDDDVEDEEAGDGAEASLPAGEINMSVVDTEEP
jgi:hypothetical protein